MKVTRIPIAETELFVGEPVVEDDVCISGEKLPAAGSDPANLRGSIYQYYPADLWFGLDDGGGWNRGRATAYIQLPIVGSAAANEELTVAVYDETKMVWVPLPTLRGENRVAAHLPHLGKVAVLSLPSQDASYSCSSYTACGGSLEGDYSAHAFCDANPDPVQSDPIPICQGLVGGGDTSTAEGVFATTGGRAIFENDGSYFWEFLFGTSVRTTWSAECLAAAESAGMTTYATCDDFFEALITAGLQLPNASACTSSAGGCVCLAATLGVAARARGTYSEGTSDGSGSIPNGTPIVSISDTESGQAGDTERCVDGTDLKQIVFGRDSTLADSDYHVLRK